jgi:hypothetical protein
VSQRLHESALVLFAEDDSRRLLQARHQAPEITERDGRASPQLACGVEGNHLALLERASEPLQAVEQEAHARAARARVADDARVENEDRKPLLGALGKRRQRGVVLEAQVVAEPVKASRHSDLPIELAASSQMS